MQMFLRTLDTFLSSASASNSPCCLTGGLQRRVLWLNPSLGLSCSKDNTSFLKVYHLAICVGCVHHRHDVGNQSCRIGEGLSRFGTNNILVSSSISFSCLEMLLFANQNQHLCRHARVLVVNCCLQLLRPCRWCSVMHWTLGCWILIQNSLEPKWLRNSARRDATRSPLYCDTHFQNIALPPLL